MNLNKIIALLMAAATITLASCGKHGGTNTTVSSVTSATNSQGEPVLEGIVYPNVYASDMSFTLNSGDLAEFNSQLAVCRSLYFANKKEDGEKLRSELYKLGSLKAAIEAQKDIAYMLYCCNIADNAAWQNYQYAVGIYDSADSKMISFYNDAKDNKNYHIQIVNKFIKEAYPGGFVLRTSEASEYNAQMISWENKFNSLSVKNAKNVLPIFQKYVDAANKYGKSMGYANYYEYVSKEVYKRDYSATERNNFRKYVKEYLVPLCKELKALSDNIYSGLTAYEKVLSESYISGDWEKISKNIFKEYCAALPASCGNTILSAFTEDRILVGKSEYAIERAFVMDVGGSPMCYINGSIKDITTVSHELGHYYARKAGMGENTSYDLREAHSQANSLLMIRYLDEKLSDNAYKDFLVYSLYNMVYTTISNTVRDEFDEILFSTEGASNYTEEEIAEIMQGLIDEYDISDISQKMVSDLSTYWYRLGISNFGYNLSYSVGAVVALQIYMQSLSSFDTAAEAYKTIVENIDKSRTFVGTVDRAGLYSPFSEKAYTALAGLIDGVK